MRKRSGDDTAEMLVRGKMALGLSQVRLAELLGLSSKTISRWIGRGHGMAPATLATFAGAVHAKDPALAARIAAAHGRTLVELGVTPPPSAAPDPKLARNLVDAILCAAAEVADVSPRAMRPALAAALERAHEAGLTMDAARALFAQAPAAPKKG